jgi:predicted transcriptional regulator
MKFRRTIPDPIDESIMLKINEKKHSVRQIAANIGLSRGAIQERITDMREKGFLNYSDHKWRGTTLTAKAVEYLQRKKYL